MTTAIKVPNPAFNPCITLSRSPKAKTAPATTAPIRKRGLILSTPPKIRLAKVAFLVAPVSPIIPAFARPKPSTLKPLPAKVATSPKVIRATVATPRAIPVP